PLTTLLVASASTSGSDIRPAWVGDMARESWKYWLRKTVEPNIVTPTMTLAKTARATVRSRNSFSGITGSATRVSTYPAASRAAIPAPTMTTVVVLPHGKVEPARLTQARSREKPAAIRVAPR